MATFTALNGGSPKASEAVNGSSVPARRNGSEERQSTAPVAPAPAPVPAPAPAPTATAAPEAGSPSGKASAPAETASASAAALNRHERERDHQQQSEAERERERPRSSWTGVLSPAEERPPAFRPTAYPGAQDSSSPHKRKRSHSPPSPTEGSRDHFGRRGGSEPRETARAAPRDRSSLSPPKPGHDTDLRRALGRESARDYERSGGIRPKFAMMSMKDDNWGPNYEQLHSAVPDSAVSEVDPIGDLAHFESSQMADADMDDSPIASSYRHTSFVPEQRRDGVVQSDPKKRKRNFSNRTKTGCLTCRRRKKKCDEAKPECSNCIKGGFVCAGYPPQRTTWAKQESKAAAVQIESKDPNYRPPGAYGMGGSREPYAAQGQSQPRSQSPGQNQNQRQSQSQSPSPSPSPSQGQGQGQRQPSLVPQAKREPLPAYRGQALRIQTPAQRLITEEARPMNMLNSPTAADGKVSARFPGVAQTMLMTPDSAGTQTKAKEFPSTRVPPLHDLSRKVPEPTSAPQQQSQLAPGQMGRTSPPPGSMTSGVQATAQMALSHTHAYSSAPRPRREKDQMLGGLMFYPYDKELMLERERCSTSVWRFNNATNPGNGVSPTERSRLFREILQPSEGVQLSQAHVSPVTHTGQLGAGVVVEAPFHADYGYNIKMADNVVVGRNCSIHDAGEVTIGANAVLSPNVCIYTTDLPLDPRQRNGARGSQSARAVHIEEDVWVGANVVILPGVRIGAGSTVGAGSLVTKDLPPRSICYGQPAKAHRPVPLS